jgi:hypothetical protein
LTDESYGQFAGAHPYVYTHQGNFPRLFTWILYSLGVRSPSWHIFITTFTVGLAGIWFCYHYFAKYISPIFSVIFCLLLMTDYVMFMQWQVNTWRVWHLFFFFSSLLCCHAVNGQRRLLFYSLSVINFCCLFYMEISYAFFVLSTCLFYMAFNKKQASWKKMAVNSCVFILGASLGVLILVSQNIAYLGLDNFLKDISYTFVSRNQLGAGEVDFKKMVMEFYAAHKIVFWDNFGTGENPRSLWKLIHNFINYCVVPYSSALTKAAIIITLATVLAYFKNWVFSIPKNAVKKQVSLGYTKTFSPTWFLYTAAFFLLVCLSAYGYVTPFRGGLFIFSLYLFIQYSLSHLNKSYVNKISFPKEGVFIILFILLCIMLALHIGNFTRDNPTAAFLNEYFGAFSGKTGGQAYWLGLIVLGVLVISASQETWIQCYILDPLKKIALFFLAASLGFCLAYFVFPGYVTTGYLYRYCCFTVFFHMALYAWFFYTISLLSYHYCFGEKKGIILELKYINYLKVGTALLVLLTASAFWVNLQCLYFHKLSPGDFSFVRLLQKSPNYGQSIISNTYAAPFAYLSNNWAHYTPSFGMSTTDASGNLVLKRDTTYLWFSDAKSNLEYLKPHLFVCWLPPGFGDLTGASQKCGNLPLVSLSRSGKGRSLGLREIMADTSGKDRWSIIDISNIRTDSMRY